MRRMRMWAQEISEREFETRDAGHLASAEDSGRRRRVRTPRRCPTWPPGPIAPEGASASPARQNRRAHADSAVRYATRWPARVSRGSGNVPVPGSPGGFGDAFEIAFG